MASQVYGQIKLAFKYLNPNEVKEIAERPIHIGLISSNNSGYSAMEEFFAPPSISQAKRYETVRALHRLGDPGAPREFDIVVCDAGAPCPPDAFQFYGDDPDRTVREILERRDDLGLALSRLFEPFRKPVVDKVIQSIARENGIFSAVTALPNVVPSFIQLPWAVGEFASDTAFLTMNQVRMSFMIAAGSDHRVGYSDQRAQIAAIVGSAFGWRALARELVGKMPRGVGIIPKAAVAYAGTYVVGAGLERFYRLGYGLTRAERDRVYADAFDRGKTVVSAFLDFSKARNQST